MDKKELYNELLKKVNTANKRLAKIEERYGRDTWGAKSLNSFLKNRKLNAIKDGKIVINEKMSETQLLAVESTVDKFLDRKNLSTLTGIKKSIKSVKEGIKESYTVSEAEAEEIFTYFENKDFDYMIKKYSEFDSEIIELIRDAQKENWTKKTWLENVKSMFDYTNDYGTKAKLDRIYKNIIKKG